MKAKLYSLLFALLLSFTGSFNGKLFATCTTVYTSLTDTINCGNSFSVGAHTYSLGGSYTDTLQSSLGCDSIVNLQLTVNPDTLIIFGGGLCAGDSFYFYGAWIYSPGEFDTLIPGNGTCDTLASLFLAVQDPLPPHHVSDTICSNDSLLFAGVYLNASGVYQHIHCDSSVILTLTVLAADSTIQSQSICSTDSFYFNGQYLHATGTYNQYLTNSIGCDSLIILNLNVGTADTLTLFNGLCASDSVYFYGTWLHSPGNYDTILPGIGTCDTLVTLTLVILDPLAPTYVYDTICHGDSIFFNGSFIDTPGTYYGHFSNQNGCDSSVILYLMVLKSDTISIHNSICEGDTFWVGSIAHTLSGNFNDTLTNVYGCDSVVNLELIVKPFHITLQRICDDFIGYNTCWISAIFIAEYTNSDSVKWKISNTLDINLDSVLSDTVSIFSYPFNYGFPGTVIFTRWFDPISVCATLYNDCGAKTFCDTISLYWEGINEINADNSISIYPNPATTELFIKTENFRPTDLAIYNVAGQLITRDKFEPVINIDKLSNGVYFIEVREGTTVARKRFIKM